MILRQKSKSFSLLELVLSLSIIALIIAFTIPRQLLLNKMLLQSELDSLAATFSFLQQKAIATGEQQKLDLSSYKLLTPQIKIGTRPGTLGPPSDPKKPVLDPVTFPGKIAIFFSNGQISPGTVYLVDINKRYMCALTIGIAGRSFVRTYD